MEQFVIRTGLKTREMQFLSNSRLIGYYYTEIAYIYYSLKKANAAIAWGKKNRDKQILVSKSEIKRLEKEVAKGNTSVNEVLLHWQKDTLKQYRSLKFKLIKL